MKYACIESQCDQFSVRMMCRLQRVKPSGYYACCRRGPSQRELDNQELARPVCTIHAESDGVYGSPKVRDVLLSQGEVYCKHRIARLMREQGLYGCPKKRYKVTTNTHHARPIAPNHFGQNFTANTPNQRWVADITYIRTGESWLCLAVILDLYSRAIVDWSMSERMTRKLILRVLLMALSRRQPEADLLHRTDHGSQYASLDFQTLLEEHGIRCSMSGASNCYDNAAMESFYGLLKRQRVNRRTYEIHEQARTDVFDYIEMFYNRQRIHGSAGKMSPFDFEQFTHSQAVHKRRVKPKHSFLVSKDRRIRRSHGLNCLLICNRRIVLESV